MKRASAAALALILILALFPVQLFAQSPVSKGSCGDELSWTFYSDGTLVISGRGDMSFDSYDAPWDTFTHEIKKVIIESGVTSIANSAFYECAMTEVELPQSIVSIGSWAFSECYGLTSVEIPEGVAALETNTFSYCYSLNSVSLPKSLKSIGYNAFSGCSSLKILVLPEDLEIIEDYAVGYDTVEIAFTGPCPKQIGSLNLHMMTTFYYPKDDPSYEVLPVFEGSTNVEWVPYDPYDRCSSFHDPGAIDYERSDDNTLITASFTCRSCGELISETVAVTRYISSYATTDTEGEVSYYASFDESKFGYYSAYEVIPCAGWKDDQYGQLFQLADGNYACSMWLLLDGKWCAFGEDGYLIGQADEPSADILSMKSGYLSREKMGKKQIAQLLADNPTDTPYQAEEIYDEMPSFEAPYAPGKVKTELLQRAADRLSALRNIAGLPGVKLDLSLSENAQYGAVLNAVSEFSHYPSKPEDMDDDFYSKGSASTSSSNIYGGVALIATPDGFMDDPGSNNSGILGHRRWQLNPALGKVGFGYAFGYGRYRYYTNEKVFDSSAPVQRYNFISWPASGSFPSVDSFIYYTTEWSVTVEPKTFKSFGLSDIRVTVERVSDGKVFIFSDTEREDGIFNVETSNYGVSNCIIFRPTPLAETYSGLYNVTITGLHDMLGNEAAVVFQIDFFDADISNFGEGILGDVNDDRVVDANDLTILSRHVAMIEQLVTEKQLGSADVNRDGTVDANDLTMLSRYVAKIIKEF